MRRVNLDELELVRDGDEPEGYDAQYAKLGPAIGAEQLGATLYVLEPGEAVCPYHYELAEEEWLLVLSGAPIVRTPDGEQVHEPGDLVCFPVGPAGAHKIWNAADKPSRVLLLSDVAWPAATVYPDSDKVGIYLADEPRRTLLPRSATVDFWTGETS